jgi:hypothetical protein
MTADASSTDARPLAARPQAAPLEDPLYYLRNMQTLVDWVDTHHADLLTQAERERLRRFRALPDRARALLTRMLMRRGDRFRYSRLNYHEIGCTRSAMAVLIEDGWVRPDPPLRVAELEPLMTRAELAQLATTHQLSLPASASKGRLLDALNGHFGTATQPWSEWHPAGDDPLAELAEGTLFQRLNLMFFGTLNQDLSAFVLTELGHQRFEAVPFSPDSRAFASRAEVDLWLELQQARDALEDGVPVASIRPLLPSRIEQCQWLEHRRGRLLFELARSAERAGDLSTALALYADSCHPDAQLRYFRVRERQQPDVDTFNALQQALTRATRPAEREALARIQRRLARALGQVPLPNPKPALPQLQLSLPAADRVESAVAAALSRPDAPVFYVENGLINGLFALLCWPALYAPLPGAFFHPFQAAPADLRRPDFVPRRRAMFDAALALLEDDRYRDTIRARYDAKHGITCPFINWSLLTPELLALALRCIPPADLGAMFRRLLDDLPAHRSGLPDLIQFYADTRRYRLIEVKGPGDRLQDHQQRWLAYCHDNGIDVSVCYVHWHDH